jgi:hypothetical protein
MDLEWFSVWTGNVSFDSISKMIFEMVKCDVYVEVRTEFSNTVGYATTNECYNEQFLSVKSGSYNEIRCYNERGGP